MSVFDHFTLALSPDIYIEVNRLDGSLSQVFTMSLHSDSPLYYSNSKLYPIKATPEYFPIDRVLRYVSSKKTMASCSLVCKTWREKSQEALFSQPLKLTGNPPVVDCLFIVPSPRNGGCLIQIVPALQNLTLRNTRLSLPDIVNFFRWLPSLNHLTIINPILTQDVKLFDYTRGAIILFSLETLTVTCSADFWPLKTFVLFLTKVLSMLLSLESCKAYMGEELTLPTQLKVSESTSPFFNIRKMVITTQRTLLPQILRIVPGKFIVPEVYEHFLTPCSCEPLEWERLQFERCFLYSHPGYQSYRTYQSRL